MLTTCEGKKFKNPAFFVCVCLARGIGRIRLVGNRSNKNMMSRGIGAKSFGRYRNEKRAYIVFKLTAISPFLRLRLRKDRSHRQMALGAGEVFQDLDFWGAIWCLPPALKRRLVEVGAGVVIIGYNNNKQTKKLEIDKKYILQKQTTMHQTRASNIRRRRRNPRTRTKKAKVIKICQDANYGALNKKKKKNKGCEECEKLKKNE